MPKTETRGCIAMTRRSPVRRTTEYRRASPPQVRTVNMIYATHIPKRERKRALRDVYALEPVAPKFHPWSSYPITFNRRDHPTSTRHGGFAAVGVKTSGSWVGGPELCV